MTTGAQATPSADYPRRFGWGMRVFLSLFLFDMVFRAMVWGLGEFGTPATGVRWVMARLEFLGNVTGIDQRWRMFGNVTPVKYLTRVRLVFDDGSSRVVHGQSTPADVSRFSRWFNEKRLQAELNAAVHADARRGYANWLAHRHRFNAAGSPLKTIEFFEVSYMRPAPGADLRSELQSRNDPLDGPPEPEFWRYDVATRTGRRVSSR